MLIPFPFQMHSHPRVPESIGVLGPYLLERPQHEVVVSALIAYLVIKPERHEEIWGALETFVMPEFVAAMRERWMQLAGEEDGSEPA